MIKIAVDDSALTELISRLNQEQLKRLAAVQEKQALLDFESGNFKLLSQRVFERIAQDMEERRKKEKLEMLWDIKKQVDQSFREKLKADILRELEEAWQRRKQEIDNIATLNNNAMELLSDELRRAKFRLENLSLSHEKKTAYLMERLEALASAKPQEKQQSEQPKPSQPVEVIRERVGPAVLTVKEIKVKDSSLDEVLNALEGRIQSQQSINDRAYTGMIVRIAELERRLKEKEVEPPKVMVRENSKDKLALKAANDKLAERLAVLQEKLKQYAIRQASILEEINKLKLRLQEVSESKHPQQRFQMKSYFEPSEERMLNEKVRIYVNKMFSKPFEQKFSAGLREQLDSKFLEIKHELMTYTKEVDKRIEDKSDRNRCRADFERVEELVSEVRLMLAGKADERTVQKSISCLEIKVQQQKNKSLPEEDVGMLSVRDFKHERSSFYRRGADRTLPLPREPSARK